MIYNFRKIAAGIVVGACSFALACCCQCGVAYAQTDYRLSEYEEVKDNYSDTIGYREYMQNVEQTRPDDVYVIEAKDYVRTDGMEVKEHTNYNGDTGISVYTEAEGLIEYEVTVETAGLYEMTLRYFPVEGNESSIQRCFFIDGELPYSEMNCVEFSRVWKNESDEWIKDNQGNEMKPDQIEAPEWISESLYDSEGYVFEKLSVYLEEGQHTITIMSLREPMVLRSITLSNDEELLTYEEMKKEQDAAGAVDTKEQVREIEAEMATKKSSQMLYPVQDQSTPAVTPYSPKYLLNNTIGGMGWNSVGDWIEWEVDVEESGYYLMSMYVKQNFAQGVPVYRRILIDGEVPFEELNGYQFDYDSDWRMDTISDEEGTPYRIYLEEGTHTIRMQVVLAEFSDIIDRVDDVIQELNSIYRQVIRITGVSPDSYRDYQLTTTLGDVDEKLVALSTELTDLIGILNEIGGVSGETTRILTTMRDQLDELADDSERFSKVLSSYKTNVSALGTWIGDITSQPLQVDRIFLYSPEEKTPEVNDGVLAKLSHEAKKLFYSFIIDYNVIGNVAEDDETRTITVWIGTGRDQANVLKSLADEKFTYETGISVNVMLVDMNTLLQATLAGQGPDVAVGVSGEIPMNFGLRNAAVDLTQFEDLDEIKDDFYASTWEPFTYEGQTYGIPETMSFPMMFYRKDILAELDLEVPITWDEMKAALSVLSNNQMDLGMLPTETVFAAMLYQNGGEYYKEGGKASDLDSEVAIEAFKGFTSYYTKYNLDRETSVTNRFRTGETPIIIAEYTTYNELVASAPDIKGLWGFTTIPGTVEEDGEVNYTSATSGLASIMLSACEDKEAAWEFMKWWTSAETQSAYGLELEGIMGEAARYPTANIEALASLPWSVSEYRALSEQLESLRGVPQVPGGYFSWRNVNNAFYTTVVSETMQPKEALTEYVRYINEEINYKRKEFNLPLLDESGE